MEEALKKQKSEVDEHVCLVPERRISAKATQRTLRSKNSES